MRRSITRPQTWLATISVLIFSLVIAAQASAQEDGSGQGGQNCQAEGAKPGASQSQLRPNQPPPPGGQMPGGGAPQQPGPDQGGQKPGGQKPGGQKPDGDKGGERQGGDKGEGSDENGQGEPQCAKFKSGFLNRVWKFEADVDGYSNGVLSATVNKVLNVPKKFKDQDDKLIDQDMQILVGGSTKVTNASGDTVAADDVTSALGGAETVSVKGKLLKRSKWNEDQDGTPTPTVRAKRIKILN